MLPVDIETYQQMEEDFGLYLLCEQNDIEPWEVVRILHLNGYIDLEDYFFGELDIEEED